MPVVFPVLKTVHAAPIFVTLHGDGRAAAWVCKRRDIAPFLPPLAVVCLTNKASEEDVIDQHRRIF